MKEEKNTFIQLYELDVKEKVEQKNGLNYLSWAYAWAEIKKIYPNAKYTIYKFGDNQLPYVYDEKTGYMVFTDVTIDDVTHEMWLPVMDGANKTMLDHSYTYQVKDKKNGGFIEKVVEQASMFDINKTIMRCLTKNLAMFGLGLSLYQGEDLPAVTTIEDAKKLVLSFGKHQGKTLGELASNSSGWNYIEWLNGNTKDENVKVATDLLMVEQEEMLELIDKMSKLEIETNSDHEAILKHYDVKSNNDMTLEQLKDCVSKLESKLN